MSERRRSRARLPAPRLRGPGGSSLQPRSLLRAGEGPRAAVLALRRAWPHVLYGECAWDRSGVEC